MDSTELEKQVNNKSDYNRNSNGVGGFGYHSENINRNGRPKSGQTWRDILIEVGETIVSQTQEKSYKLAVATKLWEEALKGNINAIKLLFERMDGAPKSFVDSDRDEALQYQMERTRQAIDAILADSNDAQEDTNSL